MALCSNSVPLCRAIYGYDAASRLASVSDGTNSATYSYLANSPMVGQIVFASNGVTRMTTSRQYDYLNRLSAISSSPSNSFAYLYNAANQRTMDRLADGSYWRYGYDALGQVTAGNKFWVDETPVAGQQFDYAFDTIGNRTQTQAGGDQNGLNLRVAGYTNNSAQPDHQPRRARLCGCDGRRPGDQQRDRQWRGGVSEERVFPGSIVGRQHRQPRLARRDERLTRARQPSPGTFTCQRTRRPTRMTRTATC